MPRKVLILAAAALSVLAPLAAPAQSHGRDDGRGVPTIAPLLEEITPAVVNISVESDRPAQFNPLFRDPFFRRFFDLPDRMPRQRRMSAGSGVIVDAARGLILTNNHVVENGDTVTVTLKDRRSFEAEVVGGDPATDIAVLRVEAERLTEIPLGDSDALKVGDFVVAVGNPFGLGQTVTSGIVSALGRSGINPQGYEDFIQTDASINPGNSGGALVTLDGRLVGINTAIISPAGGNVGIGFAVPIAMATAVMEQIVEEGRVARGRLGVIIQDLTPGLADALGIEAARGAIVAEVERHSAAEEAGVEAGDVIVSVDGAWIDGSADLRSRIGVTRPGARVEIGLIRDGRRRTAIATLDEARAGRMAALGAAGPLAGADLAALRPGMPGHGVVEGVAVASVAEGSPAARSGLRPGDVVIAVNNRRVDDPAELLDAVRDAPRAIALRIWREGAALFLVLRS